MYKIAKQILKSKHVHRNGNCQQCKEKAFLEWEEDHYHRIHQKGDSYLENMKKFEN